MPSETSLAFVSPRGFSIAPPIAALPVRRGNTGQCYFIDYCMLKSQELAGYKNERGKIVFVYVEYKVLAQK
jgi:hypothetical protein